MSDSLVLIFFIPVGFLLILFIDYLKNHCPKCYKWHPFRLNLVMLNKSSKEKWKEWVKCKRCGYEWEKLKKGHGEGGI